jgi:hypothetical protein
MLTTPVLILHALERAEQSLFAGRSHEGTSRVAPTWYALASFPHLGIRAQTVAV